MGTFSQTVFLLYVRQLLLSVVLKYYISCASSVVTAIVSLSRSNWASCPSHPKGRLTNFIELNGFFGLINGTWITISHESFAHTVVTGAANKSKAPSNRGEICFFLAEVANSSYASMASFCEIRLYFFYYFCMLSLFLRSKYNHKSWVLGHEIMQISYDKIQNIKSCHFGQMQISWQLIMPSSTW